MRPEGRNPKQRDLLTRGLPVQAIEISCDPAEIFAIADVGCSQCLIFCSFGPAGGAERFGCDEYFADIQPKHPHPGRLVDGIGGMVKQALDDVFRLGGSSARAM